MIADTRYRTIRDGPGRQRLLGRRPRVHAHTVRGCPVHGVSRRSRSTCPGTPAGKLTADARLDRPGGRRPDRARRLGVARARAHPARRLIRHARRTAPTSTPTTSTRSRSCRTTGCSSRRATPPPSTSIDHATGTIDLDARRQGEQLRAWVGARASGFQHDAHMLARNRVSLFDDEAGPPFKAPSSRGLILALDLRHRTARVARQYRRPGTTLAQSEGSVQTLPNGNAFVGFGSTEFFSEFSADRQARLRREPAQGRRQLSRVPGPVERDADDATRHRSSEADRRRWRRCLRELERRDHGRALAGARRRERRLTHTGERPPASRLRNAHRASAAHAPSSPSRRSTGAAMFWPIAERSILRDTENAARADRHRRHARRDRRSGDERLGGRLGIHKIRHVIVIMQENRSFDNYFGTYPGADGIPRLHGKGTIPCVPDPLRQALRQARTTTPRRQRRRAARAERVHDRLRQRQDGRLHPGSRVVHERARPAGLHRQPVGRHDGLPRPARDPELLGLRARLRAPGPHVRAERVVEPAGPPVPRLGMVRALHDPGRSVQLPLEHRGSRPPGRHRTGPAHAAQLRVDRSHVSALPPPGELGLLHQEGTRARLRDAARCSASSRIRTRARPASGIRCRASTTVRQDHQLGNIRDTSEFYTDAAHGPAARRLVGDSERRRQ